ncbi:lipoyl(octanoyl) transferase LipB [Leucobacter sp. CSA1]|uniref:Octanoyltransferase n=1 Tax=Leucobacter chromiisoli TaxID=2796471 RepID=A0A934UVW4_9MICO|nr:lipoyl(octanoyl) transferase LipB [Leucobacter chromiisoli]MBK0419312.1 lipoyl(octanoyl) transferase LipB [Leucobacter chromiisoli]
MPQTPLLAPPTGRAAETGPPPVDVGLVPGLVPYARGLALQREAAERVERGEDRGTVLLLEHEAVYTAGRRSLPEEYPDDGSPVIPVDRGGKVTWHGPGQLVGYPVVRLREGHGVVDFVRDLEEVLIEVAADFGVRGMRIPGRSGVWAEAPRSGSTTATASTVAAAGAAAIPGASTVAASGVPVKFAQIGLHAREGLITHGFALNCSNALEPFASFVPCGITDAGVASLSSLAGATIAPADVIPHLVPRLSAKIEEVAA